MLDGILYNMSIMSRVYSLTFISAVTIFTVFLGCDTKDNTLQNYIKYRRMADCHVDLCFPENVTFDESLDESKIERDRPECCSNCSCDVACHMRGDCCPDAPDAVKPFPPGGVFQCISDRLKPNGHIFGDRPNSYLFVSKCDVNYIRKDIKQKCELPNQSRLDQRLPVVDPEASESYRNIYCAMCNYINTSALIPWNVTVDCVHSLPDDVNSDNVIGLVVSRDDCNILFSLPFGYDDINVTCTEYENVCNASSEWQMYDRSIDDACKQSIVPFDDRYQNIFCFICNTPKADVLNYHICRTSRWKPKGGEPPSFVVLFDFRSAGEIEMMTSKSACPRNYMYDSYKAQCRPIMCSDGFTLDTGTCKAVTEGKRTYDFCYSVYLQLTPVDDVIEVLNVTREVTVDLAMTAAVKQHFPEVLINFLDAHQVKRWDLHYKSSRFIQPGSMNAGMYIQYLVLHIVMLYERNVTNVLLRMDGTDVLIPIVVRINSGTVEDDNVLQREEIYLTRLNVTLLNTPFKVNEFNNNGYHQLVMLTDNAAKVLSSSRFPLPSAGWCPDYPKQQLTHTIHCRMLELDTRDFEIHRTTAALNFVNFNISIKSNRILENAKYSKYRIRICVEDYIPRYFQRGFSIDTPNTNRSSRITTPTSVIASYLTFICTVASLISLTVTIVTYGIFPTLRSQPGINNMCLAISILCGQCIFLFGIKQTQNHIVCIFLGAVLHFSWLSVLSWTGICSYHMFRVFQHTQLQNHVVQGDRKTTAIYIAFSAMASFVLMAVNSLQALLSNNGSDLGYGETNGICWLSNPIMVLVTVSMPAGLVSMCNVCLFLSVVYHIKQSSSVKSDTVRNRNYFSVYIKLSTLTGITWLSIIPYYLTNNQVFEYIFIVLYSNQGIFIMLAFLFNKRVFTLYQVLWSNTGKPVSKSSTQTATRISTISTRKTVLTESDVDAAVPGTSKSD